MSSTKKISRSGWPWGRVPPAQRIRDLKNMVSRNLAQVPIIEDQAKEAIRRIEMNVEFLKAQIEVAERCIEEELRAKNKSLAYDLSMAGVDVIGRVDEASDQAALEVELRELLSATLNKNNAEDEFDDESFFKT